MSKQPDYQQLYLENAQQAMKEALPSGGRPLIYLTLLVIAIFLFWAHKSQIDEITRGTGKVVPSSRIQTIQNLEGGIVSEIKVAEGQSVSGGQVLLVMDDTRFISSLNEQQAARHALLSRQARLLAEVSGTDFSISDDVANKASQLVALEMELFVSRQQELQRKEQILQAQLSQQQQQLEELKAKQSLLERRGNLLQEELTISQDLSAVGAVPRVDVLRLERQVSDTRGEKVMSVSSRKRMEAVILETREKLAELKLNFTNQAREELSEVQARLNESYATGTALSDRVERTKVRSPVNGVVKSIMVSTLGGVVQPGMAMMDIVPLDDKLQIEVRIRPEDIGFLYPGQKATVRFTAYDFTIYGGLGGYLTHIGADTIVDENGDSFYLALIETDQSNLDESDRSQPVIPGMVANVDILTGKKTLLSYLLKPVLKAKTLAFTER